MPEGEAWRTAKPSTEDVTHTFRGQVLNQENGGVQDAEPRGAVSPLRGLPQSPQPTWPSAPRLAPHNRLGHTGAIIF